MDNYTERQFNSCIEVVFQIILFILIFGAIVFFLWNWLVPVFWDNAFKLSFLQSCGVVLGTRIIVVLFTRNPRN